VFVVLALASTIGAGKGRVLHAAAPSSDGKLVSKELVSPLGSKPLDGKLETMEGDNIRLSKLRGQPILLELWATWCLPCRAQAEIVGDLSEEFSRRGIRVFSVNEGEERPLVEKFLADSPSHYPVVLDRWQVVANQLEVGMLPALVLLDEKGVVVALRHGVTLREDVLAMLSVLSEELE
jgi:thiol-disulfide isomerase/thioredoxin